MEATESSGEITISGALMNGGVWQEITVLMVEEGSDLNSLSVDDIVYFYQTIPDSNGDYSVTFTMPAGQQNGTYDIYIGGVGVSQLGHTVYPTEAPTPVPPTVDMATAKPAVNNSNAFYYFITITLNDGVATGFSVKHYPKDAGEASAVTQDFGLTDISDATIKVISVLKGIPNEEANTRITSKATLTYTVGGNSGTPVVDMKEISLSDTKQSN